MRLNVLSFSSFFSRVRDFHCQAMASLAAAKAKAQLYAERRKVLEGELREIKTKQRFWDNEVAKHVRRAEKASLPSEPGKKTSKGGIKTVKSSILKGSTGAPVKPGVAGVACSVYRPDICNACRRRVMGLDGGKSHTCGKIKWHRQIRA